MHQIMWMATALLLIPAVMVSVILAHRYLHRLRFPPAELSAVSRQHIHLFQGGQINETAIESAKARFRDLLEREQIAAVEASFRPGTHFVVHVRALAELGTEDAGRILERQLLRKLTDDQIEQSWYLIDLANGLRSLNRPQSLPHLLRCAEQTGEIPLGQFFAAETVCFLGFASYLRQPESAMGRAALRVLHRALVGLRSGVQPQVLAEGRLGEAVDCLWDNRPEQVDPLVVRIFAEALRQVRRAPHALSLLTDEKGDREAFGWQISHLTALQPTLEDYLAEAPATLCHKFLKVTSQEQADILAALNDLRADAADVVLPLLNVPSPPNAALVAEVLAWSRDPAVGPRLREWMRRSVPMARRIEGKSWGLLRRRYAVPPGFPYRAALRALRGHPAAETEAVLLTAARDRDPVYRAAALSSLGWWEPWHRRPVLRCLLMARRDLYPDVRQAAHAALARLGQLQALEGFRQALKSAESGRVHDAIQLVANEGIFFLWPDLDPLADAPDADIAFHAREALETLRENLPRFPV